MKNGRHVDVLLEIGIGRRKLGIRDDSRSRKHLDSNFWIGRNVGDLVGKKVQRKKNWNLLRIVRPIVFSHKIVRNNYVVSELNDMLNNS